MRHNAYVRSNWFRQSTGAVIHCVGGDGVGIVTAMVLTVDDAVRKICRTWHVSCWGPAVGWAKPWASTGKT